VGRYSDEGGADAFKNNLIVPDMAEASAHGVEYMPVVFPGFSFHNGSRFSIDGIKECDVIPREGGKFYWTQVRNALSPEVGAIMLYVAMFDEVDEGTAMFKLAPTSEEMPAFKCLKSTPPEEAAFVPLDIDGYNLPSDWYLRLGGETGKMMRGETLRSTALPIFPLFGSVFALSIDSANTLQGAFVEVCGVDTCQVVRTDVSGQYTIPSLPAGQYKLRAFPPGGTNLQPGTIGPISLSIEDSLTGVDIVLTGPTPPPPGTTITNIRTGDDGLPWVYWGEPLTLTTQGCVGGTASYEIILQEGTVVRSGGMAETPTGTYTVTIDPLNPNSGNARVKIIINCPDSTTQDNSFDIYIDPSGRIANQNSNPIQGATVTLFRSDSMTVPFQVVPA
jgi:hypothetical protein